ncbi:MAG: hypothetical protein NTY22_02040, partial [Proteobacteria bacterium]|nr:hypothetical protein [Pseudomonadota bacterium]
LPVQLPPDGRYFAVFNDNQRKQMKVSLDDITINMLLYFCPSDEKNTIRNFLKGQTATEALGFCIGGATVMGDQVSTNVLQMADGDTCSKK